MTHMEVVSTGLPWLHAVPPCSKAAISLLERNTKVVTWLMPHGGQSHEQLPCIWYKEKYYSLSLRMQKAIYRHIRLKKGFKNEERVNGTPKLRIPDLLLKEKIRTQSRFDVREPAPALRVIYNIFLFLLSFFCARPCARRPLLLRRPPRPPRRKRQQRQRRRRRSPPQSVANRARRSLPRRHQQQKQPLPRRRRRQAAAASASAPRASTRSPRA